MPKTVAGENMVLISVHLPRQMVEELNEFVRSGSFPSRSEAIRVAIRDLLIRERARGVEQMVEELNELVRVAHSHPGARPLGQP